MTAPGPGTTRRRSSTSSSGSAPSPRRGLFAKTGERTVILLHPPLPFSRWFNRDRERERQQNDSPLRGFANAGSASGRCTFPPSPVSRSLNREGPLHLPFSLQLVRVSIGTGSGRRLIRALPFCCTPLSIYIETPTECRRGCSRMTEFNRDGERGAPSNLKQHRRVHVLRTAGWWPSSGWP